MFSITFKNPFKNNLKSFDDVTVIHVHLPNERVVSYQDAESLIIDNPNALSYEIVVENGVARLGKDWLPYSN